ncbi:MAG: lamin tail domain-containing protein [Bacteroidia bacterium]|nr:lamin tail domain-containing protein [Bacteroidia bacterium]
MKKIICSFTGGIILLFFLFTGKTSAQNVTDLRFNEVLVMNDSLNVDDFGEHSSWIEIFNSGYNTVDIGGCYLTDDIKNPKKYWIPSGDPITKIPSRCYILFWADGKPTRGIQHLNFNLNEVKTIALFDASGRELLDKLEIPQPQRSNTSYGLMEMKDESGEQSNDWVYLEKITPASNNDHSRKASAGERFVKVDPTGLGMTITAMSVVFSALALIYLIFRSTGKYFSRSKAPAAQVKTSEAQTTTGKPGELSGEMSAAIAMALHMYQSEIHDEENTVLTIKKVSRAYSPWSSKIYTLRKYPR